MKINELIELFKAIDPQNYMDREVVFFMPESNIPKEFIVVVNSECLMEGILRPELQNNSIVIQIL